MIEIDNLTMNEISGISNQSDLQTKADNTSLIDEETQIKSSLVSFRLLF
ncbi:hypothetical protein MmiHf6_00600 [Methanimicrococcus hongohii]|uniref:Uncharacterized protein n=1 Tax=Methanimicrococcus hongohii TaxID=3028295 RepID=A0AA96ZRX4_9EURY|nr:hypothetical protein MmiHf6_00600 [Methanimicrococcus sp. Hf6]